MFNENVEDRDVFGNQGIGTSEDKRKGLLRERGKVKLESRGDE